MGLLITIAVLAILFLIALKLFTVKRVVVEGNELYDQKTIEDAVLNDKYSWNSLYVYLKYKVKDTKKIPFIDTMSISLDSPHTLHISVYEKGMLGYIYIPGINENAYFDKDGFVFCIDYGASFVSRHLRIKFPVNSSSYIIHSY
jgi:cell division protein FtsQ